MNSELLSHFTWFANRLSSNHLYENVSDEKIATELKEVYSEFYGSLITKELIDFENLTVEEAMELRFRKWDKNDLWLVPLYLVPLIPKGTRLVSIFEDAPDMHYEGVHNLDLDIRFGCISWGIIIKEEK